MFERWTDTARRVWVTAQHDAQMAGSPALGTDHVLLGLLSEPKSVAGKVLAFHGVTAEVVRSKLETHRDRATETRKVASLRDQALRQALALGHSYVGTEHLLLAIVALPCAARGILVALDNDPEDVRLDVLDEIFGRPSRGQAGAREPGAPRRQAPTAEEIVAAFVAAERANGGWPPTLDEVSERLRIVKGTLHPHLGALVLAGLLESRVSGGKTSYRAARAQLEKEALCPE